MADELVLDDLVEDCANIEFVKYDEIHTEVLRLTTEPILAENRLNLWSNRVRTLTSTIRFLKGEDEEDYVW